MQQIIQVLGGMALLLFGITMLSKGMEKLAGEKIQGWLDRMTSTHLKGAVFGFGATAVLQSSSMLMVTLISLINANLMTLQQAISVMLGQEIGTTLTAQIAAFKIGEYFFIFVIAGFALLEYAAKSEWKKYGEILLGIGILFLGMTTMTSPLKALTALPEVSEFLTVMGQNIFLAVLAGMIPTALVHSSAAVIGLLVALGMAGSITLEAGIAMLLGANIGTCITGLIAGLKLSRAGLQASIAQIIINVFGVCLLLPFISPFADLIRQTATDLGRQIANAHTIFNLAVSILMFPFITLLTRLVQKLVPVVATNKEKLTHYIDDGQLAVPTIALTEATREFLLLSDTCVEMVEKACEALHHKKDKEAIHWVLDREANYVDPVSRRLDQFVNNIYLSDLDTRQHGRAIQLKNLIVDIERVADLAENLAEGAKQKSKHKVDFSPKGEKAITDLSNAALLSLRSCISAFRAGDVTLAQQAIDYEESFDHAYGKERAHHLDRLEKHQCSTEADMIFLEAIQNMERISDHAENIAQSVIQNAPGFVRREYTTAD